MPSNNDVVAVIPARGGSQRIPRKNLKVFAGTDPVILWSIRAAKQSGLFTRIIVSTDDDEIAEVARKAGAEVPFKRPTNISDNHTPTAPVVRHAVDWLMQNGGMPGIVCCIYAVAPLLIPDDLVRAHGVMKEALARGQDDAFVFTATPFPSAPQRGFTINGQGKISMVSPELATTRTQDLDELYHDCGMFYFGTPKSWNVDAILASPSAHTVPIPRTRAVDVDTPEDWEFAEAAYQFFSQQEAKKTKMQGEKRAKPDTNAALAAEGGTPVRTALLPYGKQSIDDEDVRAVVDCLHSDYLTTGPKVSEFEEAVCNYVDAKHGIAVCNGTAALHVAAFAAGIGPSDEVIVPTITFVASSNAILYMGGKVVFCDVEQDTLNIDVNLVEPLITPKTKAIVAVDMCGQPPDMDALRRLCTKHKLVLIEDASHSIGATYQGKRVGSVADITTFSFHPVKNITTGEGGMVVTDNDELAKRARSFRAHGIDLDYRTREKQPVPHRYDMNALGYNYRITDVQCALGITQLNRCSEFIRRRQEIAAKYHSAFTIVPGVQPLDDRRDRTNAHHLFVIRLDLPQLKVNRDEIFKALRKENIGVNVHYMPVHMHSYYRDHLKYGAELCPKAVQVYQEIISLPCFPKMTNDDVDDVVAAVIKVVQHYRVSDAKRAKI